MPKKLKLNASPGKRVSMAPNLNVPMTQHLAGVMLRCKNQKEGDEMRACSKSDYVRELIRADAAKRGLV